MKLFSQNFLQRVPKISEKFPNTYLKIFPELFSKSLSRTSTNLLPKSAQCRLQFRLKAPKLELFTGFLSQVNKKIYTYYVIQFLIYLTDLTQTAPAVFKRKRRDCSKKARLSAAHHILISLRSFYVYLSSSLKPKANLFHISTRVKVKKLGVATYFNIYKNLRNISRLAESRRKS